MTVLLSIHGSFSISLFSSLCHRNFETDRLLICFNRLLPYYDRCGHCKKMAPDWEKLSGEWEGHAVGLIADVDCTEEGKPLCDANGVKGFPSLKYGDPSALEDYSGARTYDALAKFATDNLKAICSPSNLDLCDDDKKKEIGDLMAKTDEELATAIEAEEKKMEAAEEGFKAEVEKLQKKYQELMEAKDAELAAVKDSGLGLMKSVKAAKAKDTKSEL
jgi:hypothetical protein